MVQDRYHHTVLGQLTEIPEHTYITTAYETDQNQFVSLCDLHMILILFNLDFRYPWTFEEPTVEYNDLYQSDCAEFIEFSDSIFSVAIKRN